MFRPRLSWRLIAPLAMALASAASAASADPYQGRRQGMLETIREHAASTAFETGRETIAPRVLSAMGRVARHAFVPERERDSAYRDRPLPIGHGQTISQPYIVALMTDLLDPSPEHRVLEVGTGSGYQAAVLSELVKDVHTIEIIEPLATAARERLARMGYGNVTAVLGDGYEGFPSGAPFDSIIVTAAASHVPPPLVSQLKPGGRMVIPVGGRFAVQYLLLVEKDAAGEVSSRQILPVRFVPLTGER